MKRVLVYGTFDILHIGHIYFLQDAKKLGDYLIVGLSTDAFNKIKKKEAYSSYSTRKEMLEALRCVDQVIPEADWDQKPSDIKEYNIDIIAMGDDWKDSEKFEKLRELCDVKYIDRRGGMSTTKIKKDLERPQVNPL